MNGVSKHLPAAAEKSAMCRRIFVNSEKPALQIRAHEGIVVEMRIGRADPVDLLLMPGSQRLARVETPDAFEQALAAQDFVAAGDPAMEVVGRVKDRLGAVRHLVGERQEFS